MKQTRILMGMPITVEIVDGEKSGSEKNAAGEEFFNKKNSIEEIEKVIEGVFAYFAHIDEKFSTYKPTSEISRINRGELVLADASDDASDEMKEVLALCEETKLLTDGWFDISLGLDGVTPAVPESARARHMSQKSHQTAQCDPSGLVKGWAIWCATELLRKAGFADFYVEAGGDIQVSGKNARGEAWSVGIRDPFDKNQQKIVKKIFLRDGADEAGSTGADEASAGGATGGAGIATSGTYIRGQHIYNPKRPGEPIADIVSLTVIGPNVYEADRFATAAFAMGREGIHFIENLRQKRGLEAYMIDALGIATMTSGFERYTIGNIYA